MKVLHLISGGDKGGAKTHVFTLLSALTEEIDIRVICFMEGAFYNEIKDMPIPSMLIKQKYRNDLTIIKPLVSHIRKEGYHLIHAHGARANFIAMFLRPFIKIPIITTVHSDYKLDFTDSLYRRFFYTGLNRLALKYMDYYIAVSESFKAMLEGRGFPGDKIYTVYNTIDFERKIDYTSREEFYNRYNIDARGKTVVGIIGRFDYVKGHDIFINAAAEVLKKNKDVIFLLAGEGTEQPGLEQQAEKLGIKDKVIFTGFVDDIFSFINAIDINALSSRSESFPYVLLEGARMKKATVSTNVGGIGDLIKEDETGLLAEPGNFKELAEKILKFVNDEDFRNTMGENLYHFASKNFSKESMKRRHISIYEDVLRRRKTESKLFDVVLFGYYGYSNSGDEAILKSIISSLKEEKEDINILVLSRRPSETTKEHKVFAINRYNIFQTIKYLKISRAIIYGGGSLIQDVTSTRSLVYYTFVLKISKYFGLKLMLYGNGIGPVLKERNILRAQKALELCDYISLRDPESFTEIKRLGVKNENVHVSVDPVFAIKLEENKKPEDIFRAEGIKLSGKYFVVSVRMWRFNDSEFCRKMAEVIKEISKKYHITPIYIPMLPDDIVIIKDIAGRAEVDCGIIKKVYDISSIMALIGGAELVLSMRLHALIYAVSGGVPVIGLSYDPKVKSFIEYIKEEYCMDTSSIDTYRLMEMADEIMCDREKAAERIRSQAARLKSLSGHDAKEAIRLVEG